MWLRDTTRKCILPTTPPILQSTVKWCDCTSAILPSFFTNLFCKDYLWPRFLSNDKESMCENVFTLLIMFNSKSHLLPFNKMLKCECSRQMIGWANKAFWLMINALHNLNGALERPNWQNWRDLSPLLRFWEIFLLFAQNGGFRNRRKGNCECVPIFNPDGQILPVDFRRLSLFYRALDGQIEHGRHRKGYGMRHKDGRMRKNVPQQVLSNVTR